MTTGGQVSQVMAQASTGDTRGTGLTSNGIGVYR